jgi:hypothetical protein
VLLFVPLIEVLLYLSSLGPFAGHPTSSTPHGCGPTLYNIPNHVDGNLEVDANYTYNRNSITEGEKTRVKL